MGQVFFCLGKPGVMLNDILFCGGYLQDSFCEDDADVPMPDCGRAVSIVSLLPLRRRRWTCPAYSVIVPVVEIWVASGPPLLWGAGRLRPAGLRPLVVHIEGAGFVEVGDRTAVLPDAVVRTLFAFEADDVGDEPHS